MRQKDQQELEIRYRTGYHHGASQVTSVFRRLLQEGIPASAALELLDAYIEGVLVPWRVQIEASSAPPIFDVSECQQLLQQTKEQQSR